MKLKRNSLRAMYYPNISIISHLTKQFPFHENNSDLISQTICFNGV